MRARTTSRGLVGAAVALAVAAASVVSVPGSAASASTYNVPVTPVGLTSPRALLDLGGKLVASDGDTVTIMTEVGAVVSTVTGIPGAAGLAAAADGTRVFVAEAASPVNATTGTIATVDVTTGTAGATYTVGPCPRGLALMGSTLFYSYGCSPLGSVGHVNLDDGTVADLATPDAAGLDHAPRLTAGATVLFGSDPAGGTRHVYAWPVTGAALGTRVTSVATYFVEAIAAHGDRLAVAESGTYAVHDLDASLTEKATFVTDCWSDAVAWSQDGSRLAVGCESTEHHSLLVFDTVTRAAVVRAYALAPNGGGNAAWVLNSTIAFSADESRVLALGFDPFGPGDHIALVTSSSSAPTVSKLTIAAHQPARYGLAMTVTVTTPGRPNTPVTVSQVLQNGTRRVRTVVTGSTGVGVLTYKVATSGFLSATAPGDFTHTDAATREIRYVVPAALSVAMSRGYATRSGVVRYHKATDVRIVSALLPARAGIPVTASLLTRSAGRWRLQQRIVLTTRAHGLAGIYLSRAVKGGTYEVTFTFAGDTTNGRATRASSPFVVG